MARKAREQSSGEVYHLIQRGLNKINIFKNIEDKEFFLNALKERAEKYYVKIYAYIVMDNHYHIVARNQLPNLSRFMMSLNTTYAKYWVKREGWTGYVYQDRFKSIRIKTDEQLLQTIRYIHLNRVRVCGDEGVDEYLYSGHLEIIGNSKKEIIGRNEVLKLFDEKIDVYKKFIEEGVNQNIAESKKIVYQDIPDVETQKKLLYKDRLGEHLGSEEEKYKWVYEIERIKGEIRRKRKSDLLKAVAKEGGIRPEELRSKSIRNPNIVECKRLMCFVGRTYLDFQLRELSDYLGVHENALGRGVKKIEDRLRSRDKTILFKIKRVLNYLKKAPKRKK